MHKCAYHRPPVRPVVKNGPDTSRPHWLPVDWTWEVKSDPVVTIVAKSAPWLLGAEEVYQLVTITRENDVWVVRDGCLRVFDGCPADWPDVHAFTMWRDARAYLAYLAEDDMADDV